jgi:hypothetical protein
MRGAGISVSAVRFVARRTRILRVYFGATACVASCLYASLHATAQEAPANSSYRVVGVTKDRVQITSPLPPLKLEEENEIPILLNRNHQIHAAILGLSYEDPTYFQYTGLSDTNVSVKYHTDGSAYVEVIPECLGRVRITLQLDFEDGYMGVAAAENAEVVLPDRNPESLIIDDPGLEGTTYLDLTGKSAGVQLWPKAVYQGALHAVRIPPKYVSYKVIAEDEGNPPVAVDATGMVRAHNYGHALVDAEFEGISVLKCINVQVEASLGTDRTNCSELIPPGMDPPKDGDDDLPSQLEKSATTPRVKIPPPKSVITPQ